MSALASLTADYTDSEEEDNKEEEEQLKNSLVDKLKEGARSATPSSVGGSNSASAKSTPTKKMRLVSYAEEGAEDEEEEEEGGKAASSEDGDVVDMELDSENGGLEDEDEKEKGEEKKEDLDDTATSQSSVQVETWSGGGQLPPEPQGQCDPQLQKSVSELYRRKRENGYDLNAVIQQKKGFRNPSIYEKLIQFCDIDEMGTNFPHELYDGHLFGKESYYDELAKVQAADMERREKAEKNKAGARSEPVVVPKKPSGNEGSKERERKSKWDQGAPMTMPPVAAPARQPTKPAALPTVAAPTVVSASVPKPTVISASSGVVPAAAPGAALPKTISAFGPLKK